LRPEAGHRVGQIGGGRHEADAWDLERGRRVDPADPRAQSWVIYYWLTTLQDGLVQTAMR